MEKNEHDQDSQRTRKNSNLQKMGWCTRVQRIEEPQIKKKSEIL